MVISERTVFRFLELEGSFIDHEQTCRICLVPLHENGPLVCHYAKKIAHIFHETCLDQWRRVKNECPTCKQSFCPLPGDLILKLKQLLKENRLEEIQELFLVQEAQIPETFTKKVLQAAIANNQPEHVRFFITHISGICYVEVEQWTFLAIQTRSLECLQLIKAHVSAPDFEGALGTALRFLAIDSQLELVDFLLGSGFKIDPVDRGSALVSAARHGNVQMAQSLLSGNVTLSLREKLDAWEIAFKQGHFKMMLVLFPSKEDIAATLAFPLQCLRNLLKEGERDAVDDGLID